jgi:hypothetical protein
MHLPQTTLMQNDFSGSNTSTCNCYSNLLHECFILFQLTSRCYGTLYFHVFEQIRACIQEWTRTVIMFVRDVF